MLKVPGCFVMSRMSITLYVIYESRLNCWTNDTKCTSGVSSRLQNIDIPQ